MEVKVVERMVRRKYFELNGELRAPGYDDIGNPQCGMYPVKKDGKLGFADEYGKLIIPTDYDLAQDDDFAFSYQIDNDFIVVSKDMHKGLYRHDGTLVCECVWDDFALRQISEGFVPIMRHQQGVRKWGFLNVESGKVINPFYDQVRNFRDGLAPICVEEKWGVIDSTGNTLVQPTYDEPFRFDGDFAIVKDGANNKVIMKSGRALIDTNDSVFPNKDGSFRLVKMTDNIHREETNVRFERSGDILRVIENGVEKETINLSFRQINNDDDD